MSTSETFRKLPTEWLDVNDKKTGQENPTEAPEFRPFAKRERTVDLDTIIVMEPKEPSTLSEGSREKKPTGRALPQQNRSSKSLFPMISRAEAEWQETALKVPADGRCASKNWFPKLTYQHIGSARYVGDFTLLFLRVALLFILAISGGLAYGHRDQIQLGLLHTELFVWLHFWFFIVYPLLLLSSILTLRTLNPEAVHLNRVWTFTSAVFHVLATLAQVELFRLLLLHLVLQLRPANTSETVYSLTSTFAGQRYIMFVASLTEFYFSTIPYFVEYLLLTVLISAVWETGCVFIRDLDPKWVKIVLSIAMFSFTSIIASINFLIANKLPGSKRKTSAPSQSSQLLPRDTT